MPSGLDQALVEHRDDVLPIIVSAIEKNADEDWLAGMVMDEEFDPGVKVAVGLLNPRRILEKLVSVATEEEKAVLTRNGSLEYLEKVQKRVNELHKQDKEVREAQYKAFQEQKGRTVAAPAASPLPAPAAH